jgi:hypothetical protein
MTLTDNVHLSLPSQGATETSQQTWKAGIDDLYTPTCAVLRIWWRRGWSMDW